MPGANIRALCEDRDLKFLFVGGKGGVGKTTTSSSIASQLAYDRKVLLISTDPAHSLGDAFRMEFCGEPRMVTGVPNLEVMEVNPETNLQAEIQGWAEMAVSELLPPYCAVWCAQSCANRPSGQGRDGRDGWKGEGISGMAVRSARH
eukprot:SAG31_NODE_842_length_11586_cov_9.084966_8_plen_147_part_00